MTFGGFVAGIKNFAGDAVQDQGGILVRIGGASRHRNDPVRPAGARRNRDNA